MASGTLLFGFNSIVVTPGSFLVHAIFCTRPQAVSRVAGMVLCPTTTLTPTSTVPTPTSQKLDTTGVTSSRGSSLLASSVWRDASEDRRYFRATEDFLVSS